MPSIFLCSNKGLSTSELFFGALFLFQYKHNIEIPPNPYPTSHHNLNLFCNFFALYAHIYKHLSTHFCSQFFNYFYTLHPHSCKHSLTSFGTFVEKMVHMLMWYILLHYLLSLFKLDTKYWLHACVHICPILSLIPILLFLI